MISGAFFQITILGILTLKSRGVSIPASNIANFEASDFIRKRVWEGHP